MRSLPLLCSVCLACSGVSAPTRARIDEAAPPVILTVEGPGNHEPIYAWEGDGGVLLRLRNNTVWPLGVEALTEEGVPTEGSFSLCGRVVAASRDGARVRALPDLHEVIPRPRQTGGVIDVSGAPTGTFVWVSPGRSIFFTLPENALRGIGWAKLFVTFSWEYPCPGPDAMPSLMTTIPMDVHDLAWKVRRWSSLDAGS
jgi:hypothetical protein